MMRNERRYLTFEELEINSKRIVSLKDYITKKNTSVHAFETRPKKAAGDKEKDRSLDKLLKENRARLSLELAQDAAEELQEEAKRIALAAREAESALEERRREAHFKAQERAKLREIQDKTRQDWFKGNGWMNFEGRVNLEKIGAVINLIIDMYLL